MTGVLQLIFPKSIIRLHHRVGRHNRYKEACEEPSIIILAVMVMMSTFSITITTVVIPPTSGATPALPLIVILFQFSILLMFFLELMLLVGLFDLMSCICSSQRANERGGGAMAYFMTSEST